MNTIRILLAVFLALGGFWMYVDTFKRSAEFTPDTGAIRIACSVGALTFGSLLAAFSFVGVA